MCTWAGMSRMCSAAQVTAAAAALALAGARPSELEAGGESSDSPGRGAPGGPDPAASVATRRPEAKGARAARVLMALPWSARRAAMRRG